MASVKAFIRVSAKKKNEKGVSVRFRISDGRKIQLFYKSDIIVDPNVWDAKKECIKAKVLYSEDTEFKRDAALPVVSNQKMNKNLHELCRLAGFDKPIRYTYFRGTERIDEVKPKYAYISTHTGRRSFICNALALGIAPQIVMKWTGHSDYKAMKPYIDVADSIKADAMKMFDNI